MLVSTTVTVHTPLADQRLRIVYLEFQSLAERFGSSEHQRKLASTLHMLWNVGSVAQEDSRS
jgi:hypothetical protein